MLRTLVGAAALFVAQSSFALGLQDWNGTYSGPGHFQPVEGTAPYECRCMQLDINADAKGTLKFTVNCFWGNEILGFATRSYSVAGDHVTSDGANVGQVFNPGGDYLYRVQVADFNDSVSYAFVASYSPSTPPYDPQFQFDGFAFGKDSSGRPARLSFDTGAFFTKKGACSAQ